MKLSAAKKKNGKKSEKIVWIYVFPKVGVREENFVWKKDNTGLSFTSSPQPAD